MTTQSRVSCLYICCLHDSIPFVLQWEHNCIHSGSGTWWQYSEVSSLYSEGKQAISLWISCHESQKPWLKSVWLLSICWQPLQIKWNKCNDWQDIEPGLGVHACAHTHTHTHTESSSCKYRIVHLVSSSTCRCFRPTRIYCWNTLIAYMVVMLTGLM